jgi:hypothetical protein
MSRPPPLELESRLSGLRPWAVLRGVLWDNALTLVCFVVIASYWPEGASEELFASTRFGLAMLITGTACTVFGGYLAAARAGVAAVTNGAAVGVANLALGLVGSLIPVDAGPLPPLWLEALGYAVVVPAGALGGFLWRPVA